MARHTKTLIAAGSALALGAGVLTNVGNVCDHLGLGFCIEDVEQSVTIGTIKLEHQVTYREFLARESERVPRSPENDLRTIVEGGTRGIVTVAQVTAKGYEGESIVIQPVLQRMPGNQRVLGNLVAKQAFIPRAAATSRSAQLWVEAPAVPGRYVIEVRVQEDKTNRVLTIMDTTPFEWPPPVLPVAVPFPRRVITGPYDEQYTSENQTRPQRPEEPEGYWARVSFRYLGDPACDEGGRDFRCHLPLRTAPDFRDSVGRPITRGWPVDGRDWVWVVCQADGNGIEGEGLLKNAQGAKSNRWNLIYLGDHRGTRSYAWGNDIWFAPKGPLAPDATPKFPCDKAKAVT